MQGREQIRFDGIESENTLFEGQIFVIAPATKDPADDTRADLAIGGKSMKPCSAGREITKPRLVLLHFHISLP